MATKRLRKNQVRITALDMGQKPRVVGTIDKGQVRAFYEVVKGSPTIFMLTDAQGKIAGIIADSAYLVTTLHKSF